MDTQTAHALIRFGLGRRGTETLPDDPVAWLRAQIEQPDQAQFPGTGTASDGLNDWRLDTYQPLPVGQPSRLEQLQATETQTQLANLLTTAAPYRERMVLFWSNHFTVSLSRPEVPPVMGAFIREAIRPHVTGRFTDMVLAVMQHPAMQLYLDNWLSIGPNSPVGLRTGSGLNENLGRECMELHTLSPASGYTQADVTAFAAVLTGWTLDLTAAAPHFVFDPSRHEPGPKTVLGRVYQAGFQGGYDALQDFADHPSTYRFLATKLCRHFIADEPDPSDIAVLAGALQDTHGDLAVASLQLIAMPSAWKHPLAKFRSAQDYAIAALRAADLPPGEVDPAAVMTALGQSWWTAPQPNGWPDRAPDWAGQVGLLARAEWSHDLATRISDRDPVQMAQNSLGTLLRPATMARMRAAGSRTDAMTLLLASPEFMRR